MHILRILYSIDPSVGKVDKHALSQQTLMELFIENIENKENICRDPECTNDIYEWNGFLWTQNREVCQVGWSMHKLRGSLNLQWLPSTVRSVWLYVNQLEGSVNLTCLPEKINVLQMKNNHLTGEIDLCHLPEALEVLNLSINRLTGKIDLTSLPLGMKSLFLNKNDFSREAEFSQLPNSLKHLCVSNTHLFGEVHARWRKVIRVDNSDVKFIE